MPSINPTDYDFSKVKCNNFAEALKRGFISQVLFKNKAVRKFTAEWDGTYTPDATGADIIQTSGRYSPGFTIYRWHPYYSDNTRAEGYMGDEAFMRVYNMGKSLRVDKMLHQIMGDVSDAKEWREPFPTVQGYRDLMAEVLQRKSKLSGLVLQWTWTKVTGDSFDQAEKDFIINEFKTRINNYSYDGEDTFKIKWKRVFTDTDVYTGGYKKYEIHLTAYEKDVDGNDVEIVFDDNALIDSLTNECFNYLIANILTTEFNFPVPIEYNPWGGTATRTVFVTDSLQMGGSVEFVWSDIAAALETDLFDWTEVISDPSGEGDYVNLAKSQLAVKLGGLSAATLADTSNLSKSELFLLNYTNNASDLFTNGIDLAQLDPVVAGYAIRNMLKIHVVKEKQSLLKQALSFFGGAIIGGLVGWFCPVCAGAAVGATTAGAALGAAGAVFGMAVTGIATGMLTKSTRTSTDDSADMRKSLECDDERLGMESWYPEVQIANFMKAEPNV